MFLIHTILCYKMYGIFTGYFSQAKYTDIPIRVLVFLPQLSRQRHSKNNDFKMKPDP